MKRLLVVLFLFQFSMLGMLKLIKISNERTEQQEQRNKQIQALEEEAKVLDSTSDPQRINQYLYKVHAIYGKSDPNYCRDVQIKFWKQPGVHHCSCFIK